MNKWAKNILDLRKQAKVTQEDLAKEVGVTQRAISLWERDINEPKASYIVALAKYFGVSADYLLGLED